MVSKIGWSTTSDSLCEAVLCHMVHGLEPSELLKMMLLRRHARTDPGSSAPAPSRLRSPKRTSPKIRRAICDPEPIGFHFAERKPDRSLTRLMMTGTCVLRSVFARGPQSGPAGVANHGDPLDWSVGQDFLVFEPVCNGICNLRPNRLTGLIVQMDHRCHPFCDDLEYLS
jgi:hypothetical protein